MTITITLLPGLLVALAALFHLFMFLKVSPSTDWGNLAKFCFYLGIAIWLGFGN